LGDIVAASSGSKRQHSVPTSALSREALGEQPSTFRRVERLLACGRYVGGLMKPRTAASDLLSER
jgi:hypothetical protein